MSAVSPTLPALCFQAHAQQLTQLQQLHEAEHEQHRHTQFPVVSSARGNEVNRTSPEFLRLSRSPVLMHSQLVCLLSLSADCGVGNAGRKVHTDRRSRGYLQFVFLPSAWYLPCISHSFCRSLCVCVCVFQRKPDQPADPLLVTKQEKETQNLLKQQKEEVETQEQIQAQALASVAPVSVLSACSFARCMFFFVGRCSWHTATRFSVPHTSCLFLLHSSFCCL